MTAQTDKSVAEKAKEILLRREAARRHLLPFVTTFNKSYDAGWVHKDICQRLERFSDQVARKESPRLMIFMPPRAGKSELVSRNFPAWHLGRHPDHEIISTSYASALAIKFSRKVREIIRDPEYKHIFPDTELHPEFQNVENWLTTAEGGYLSAGVNGPLTGNGFHVGIIDDYIKNAEEAESETIRQAHKEWYASTFYTRAAPGAGIIVMACLTGDTPVTMADGTRKRIDAIEPGDSVLAWEDGKQVVRRVLGWKPQGEDDVFELRTGNHKVRANARHPFLVATEQGYEWVRTADLEPGMQIVCSGVEAGGGTARLTRAQAWLLGFMFGDGWVTVNEKRNYSAKYDKRYATRSFVTCVSQKSDAAKNRKVARLLKLLFGTAGRVTRFGYRRMEVAAVGRWFLEHGLAGTAKTKRLPDWLFAEPLQVRLAFLTGLVAADGYVDERGRQVIGLSNADLLADVRHLARSCGYRPTNIYTKRGMAQPPNSPAPVAYEHHVVSWLPERTAAPFETARLTAVTPAGREVVYDIQVEGAECFLADGLVSHNTRWHHDDLSGWLLKEMAEGGEQWEVVEYPAIAIEDEKYRRKGEALHPARYPLEALKRIERSVGPRVWQALYQQRPTLDEGSYITRSMLRFYGPAELPPLSEMTKYMTCDLAIGQKSTNDYSVFLVAGVDRNERIWLLDLKRGRWDGYDLVENILDLYTTWRPELTGIERGHIEMALGPFLERRIAERRLYEFHYEPLKPGRNDKQARGRPIQGRMKQGMVMIPKDAEWTADFVKELLEFPNGVNDDQFDALAWLGQMINQFATVPLITETAPSWRDKIDQILNPRSSGASAMGA